MVEKNVKNIHRAVNNGGEQDATDTMACYFENRDADDLVQKRAYGAHLPLEIDGSIPHFRDYNCNQTTSRAKSSGR